jgi:hypothetical protein
MTRDEAVAKLIELRDGCDQELDHKDADKLIVAFLKSIGYADVAEAYESVPKWFA